MTNWLKGWRVGATTTGPEANLKGRATNQGQGIGAATLVGLEADPREQSVQPHRITLKSKILMEFSLLIFELTGDPGLHFTFQFIPLGMVLSILSHHCILEASNFLFYSTGLWMERNLH